MSEGECSLGSVLARTSEPSRMSLGQKMNSSSWAARSLASQAAGGNGLSSSKRDGAKWGGTDGRTDGRTGNDNEGGGGPRFDLLRLLPVRGG